MRLAIPALACVALLGCATDRRTEDTMNQIIRSWRGAPAAEAVGRWGPPDKQWPDGKGNQVMQWTQANGTGSTGGVAQTFGGPLGGGAHTATTFYSFPETYSLLCYRRLVVSPAGTVLGGYWEGNDCCTSLTGRCARLLK
jgi:hypothetical protein